VEVEYARRESMWFAEDCEKSRFNVILEEKGGGGAVKCPQR
jgi:hypothetical protein